ncbi:MAG: rod shape-determining protein RodA [Candidatus Omnitrophica bacterium]|nr:rod shape-determining protein RodA [Candidatus Omnitrophota bacterium]
MNNYHFKIFFISILISILGIFTIYSVRYPSNVLIPFPLYIRQIIWISLGLVLCWIIYKWDVRKLWDIAYFLYIITLVLLILVDILGYVRLGAQRWLRILWLNFQPSELAKLSIIVILARYFSHISVKEIRREANFIKSIFIPFLLIIVPMFLILQQPDLGTALMLFFIYVSLVYFAGIKRRYLLIFFLFLICLSPLLWVFLKDYQKERLLVFINPDKDPLGAGYTVTQSKITVGSGRLFGKGWLGGTQGQLRFLPEAHTDFIFASFSEEWGFLGSIFLIGLYYLFIFYGLKIAEHTEERFKQLLALGIVSMFFIQIFINISMTLGIAPVVGLPLVFFSYGGSSVVISFLSVGILMSINKRR